MAVTVQAQRVPTAVPLLHDGSNEFIGRLQEIGLQARGDQRRLLKHLTRFQQVLLHANFRAGSKALFAARLVQAPQVAANPFHLIKVIRFELTTAKAWENGKVESLMLMKRAVIK
ncbi:Uncharacterised protein [Klebsiella pneumoniae]|nr:Uncharacterised protein [Klebsiella pneumoniae]